MKKKITIDLNKGKFLFICLWLISYLVPQNLAAQAVPEKYKGVMLQDFYWDSYKNLERTALTDQTYEISSYFDMIRLSQSRNVQNGGMGYLPIYYFDQNGAFGTTQDIKTLINTLKAKGCGAIANMVTNYRIGKSKWTDFPSETYNGVTYTWGTKTICADDEVMDKSGQANPAEAPDTGDNYPDTRDIDHTNLNVENTIKVYLDFMKNETGYTGWHYDYAKGHDAEYVSEYKIRPGAFDFALKFELNEDCHNGNWGKLCWKRYSSLNQPVRLIHMDSYTRFTYILAANAFIPAHPGISGRCAVQEIRKKLNQANL